MSTPGFFVYRDSTPGEPIDPCAALQFFPAKDSDELFFALKTAYPLVKTHSERMRNAVIDFLIKERDEEQAKSQAPFPVDASAFESTTASPWSSFPSVSSSSTLSSPDLIDLATPASFASPAVPAIPSMPSLNRQPSQASSSNAYATPAIDQMTSVFSLSDHSQPKTRVRRKMTESEKAEYKKRRIVKACDKCSKRKRKCSHNQSQMETLASQQKVTKRKSLSPASGTSASRQLNGSTTPPSAVLSEHLSFNDDPLFSLASSREDDDFFNLFDLEMAPQHDRDIDWPWNGTQDWTLLDAPYQPGHYTNPSADRMFADESCTLYPSRTSESPGTVLINDPVVGPASATHTRHVHDTMFTGDGSGPLSGGASMASGLTPAQHETWPINGPSNFVEGSSAGLAASDSGWRPSSAVCWAEADIRTAASGSSPSSGHGSKKAADDSLTSDEYGDSVLDVWSVRRQRPSGARHTAIEVAHKESAGSLPLPGSIDDGLQQTEDMGFGSQQLVRAYTDASVAQSSQTAQRLEHTARAFSYTAGLTGVLVPGLSTARISSRTDLSGRAEYASGMKPAQIHLGYANVPSDSESGTKSLLASESVHHSNKGLLSENEYHADQKDGHTNISSGGAMHVSTSERSASTVESPRQSTATAESVSSNTLRSTKIAPEPAASRASAALLSQGGKPALAAAGRALTVRQVAKSSPSTRASSTTAANSSQPQPHEKQTIAQVSASRDSRKVFTQVGTTPPAQRPTHPSGVDPWASTSSASSGGHRQSTASVPTNPAHGDSPTQLHAASHGPTADNKQQQQQQQQERQRKQFNQNPPFPPLASGTRQSHGRASVVAGCPSGMDVEMAMFLNAQILHLVGAMGGAAMQLMNNSAMPFKRKREGFGIVHRRMLVSCV
ncbi:hypothetical protein MBLNU459_g0650t1 [Dothideomycetes sp. NU459]